MNTLRKTRKFEIFLFTFNSVSSNAALLLMGYYMFFTQNVLGLAAAVVGIIATAMRIWDAITDPIIGLMIDKTDGRFGKFRPYIAASFFLMCIPMVLLFYTPVHWSAPVKYAYTAILYAIYIVGYTCQTCSTRAAQAILTKDPKMRPLFSQFQTVTVGISGAVLPFIMTTVMAPKYDLKMLDPAFWKSIIWVFVLVMGVATTLAIFGLRHCDVHENFGTSTYQKVSYRDMWSVIKGNRAIQMLIISGASDKIATLTISTVSVYIFSNLLLNNALNGTFQMLTMAPTILLSVVLINFSKSKGLRKPFVCYSAVSVILLCVMLVVGARPETTVIFLTIYAVQNLLVKTINYMTSPMIADCTDYETYRSGKFVPGIVGTVFTFVDKFISAFGTMLVGFALSFIGVGNQALPTDTYISDKFYWTIMLLFCVPMIIGNLANVVAMKFYPLTKEKMEEIQLALKERAAAQNTEN